MASRSGEGEGGKMSYIPRVSEFTRERISREFDDLGPAACVAEILGQLQAHNPEVLDMMSKCATDVGNPDRIMVGFAMFYRLLLAEELAVMGRTQGGMIPRVAPETRDMLVRDIDEKGPDGFTFEAIDQLHDDNPELLQMAHNFASRHESYLGIMQGFCLVYQSIAIQSAAERRNVH